MTFEEYKKKLDDLGIDSILEYANIFKGSMCYGLEMKDGQRLDVMVGYEEIANAIEEARYDLMYQRFEHQVRKLSLQ